MLNKYIKALEKYFFHAVHLFDSLINIINRYYIDFDDLKSILVHFKSRHNHVVVTKSGGSSYKYFTKRELNRNYCSEFIIQLHEQIRYENARKEEFL